MAGAAAGRSVLALGLAAMLASCGRGDGAIELASASFAVPVESGASKPTVALGRDGVTYLAWVGTSAGGSNVFLVRARPDGAFGRPVRVNDRPGDAAPHDQAPAQVAAGPDGAIYVVWQNNRAVEGRSFPASDLRFARSTDQGRSFAPAIHVNDDAGGPPASHTFQDLAVAPDGTIYVSWIDGRLRPEAGSADTAAAEHGTHGTGGVAGAGPQIRVARSNDGGRTFEPSRVVDDEACPCCRTSLATGPDGAVYVAWRKLFDDGVRDIVVARSPDGGQTFSSPVRVHRDGWVIDACPHAGPALTVDRDGRVHVAWFTGADRRAGAYYAAADATLRFGRPTRLTDQGRIATTQVDLAVGDDGAVWVAWEGLDEGMRTVRLARAEGGALRTVEGLGRTGRLPAVAASGDRMAVAWLVGESIATLRGASVDR